MTVIQWRPRAVERVFAHTARMIESLPRDGDLSKPAQARVIEQALAMLERLCPDWAVYAEPRENINDD